MELAFIVYLISVFSKVSAFTTVLLVLAFFASVISVLAYCEGCSDEDFWVKCFKTSLVTVFVSAFVVVTVPGEKTMYTMAGAYAAQQVVQNPEVQKLSGKVLKVIETKLDGYVEEQVSKAEKAVKN